MDGLGWAYPLGGVWRRHDDEFEAAMGLAERGLDALGRFGAGEDEPGIARALRKRNEVLPRMGGEPPGSWHLPSAVRAWRFWLDDRITRVESLRSLCGLRSVRARNMHGNLVKLTGRPLAPRPERSSSAARTNLCTTRTR